MVHKASVIEVYGADYRILIVRDECLFVDEAGGILEDTDTRLVRYE